MPGGAWRPVQLVHKDQVEEGQTLPDTPRADGQALARGVRFAAADVPVPLADVHRTAHGPSAVRPAGRSSWTGCLLGRGTGTDGGHGGPGAAQTGRLAPEHTPSSSRTGMAQHTVTAHGTYMAHRRSRVIATDGASGQAIDRRCCHYENTEAPTAPFSRIPQPDALIAEGLRGAQKVRGAI